MCVCVLLSGFLFKTIRCGYSLELHRQVDAIRMGTHNICLYKEVEKKYTGCKLRTTELLDRALIWIYAVIRSNTVVPNVLPVSELCVFACFDAKIGQAV